MLVARMGVPPLLRPRWNTTDCSPARPGNAKPSVARVGDGEARTSWRMRSVAATQPTRSARILALAHSHTHTHTHTHTHLHTHTLAHTHTHTCTRTDSHRNRHTTSQLPPSHNPATHVCLRCVMGEPSRDDGFEARPPWQTGCHGEIVRCRSHPLPPAPGRHQSQTAPGQRQHAAGRQRVVATTRRRAHHCCSVGACGEILAWRWTTWCDAHAGRRRRCCRRRAFAS